MGASQPYSVRCSECDSTRAQCDSDFGCECLAPVEVRWSPWCTVNDGDDYDLEMLDRACDRDMGR